MSIAKVGKMTNRSTQELNIECYRGRWPDTEVPPNQPTWLYYEIETVADVVLRTVHIFADGRIERNSIALEERKGDQCPSLVEGPFIETARSVLLDLIPPTEFEELWQRGTDTLLWFPDSFPKTFQF
jgi:hypothetical protein